jgi:hypothetical protein
MEFLNMDGEAVKAIEMESLLIGETRDKIYRRGK